ncbi:MAG: hypothetical protein OEN21_09920 [Myxococcales bacterium]|nr:hypothetical protein [Myxococcales bacterium]
MAESKDRLRRLSLGLLLAFIGYQSWMQPAFVAIGLLVLHFGRQLPNRH